MPVYEAESQERRAERQPAQVLEPEMQVLDTAKLALLMVKSLRGLAAGVRRAQERDAAVRAEARKLMGIAALCGGVIPDDVLAMFGSKPKRAAVVVSAGNSEAAADMLVCPDCGREFGTSGGFGIHRARIHEGKSWDSSANFKPKAVEAVNGGE